MTLRSQLVTELDRQKTPAVEDVIVEHDGRVGEDDVAASADTVVVRVHLLEVVEVWDATVLRFAVTRAVTAVRDAESNGGIEPAAVSARLTSRDDSLDTEVLHDFNASSTSVAST